MHKKCKYIIIYNNKYDNYGGNGRKATEARNDHSPTEIKKNVTKYIDTCDIDKTNHTCILSPDQGANK